MPRYEIRDPAGQLINTIIVPADQVSVFTPEGGTAVSVSKIDRSLSLMKAAAHDRLFSAIAAARRKLVTELPGQEMIYLRKEDEAKRIIADPDPQAISYPILAGEVGLLAPTLYQAAQIILWKSAVWQAIAAALEAYRFRQTALIDASGEDEIEALVAKDHAEHIGVLLDAILAA